MYVSLWVCMFVYSSIAQAGTYTERGKTSKRVFWLFCPSLCMCMSLSCMYICMQVCIFVCKCIPLLNLLHVCLCLFPHIFVNGYVFWLYVTSSYTYVTLSYTYVTSYTYLCKRVRILTFLSISIHLYFFFPPFLFPQPLSSHNITHLHTNARARARAHTHTHTHTHTYTWNG